MAFDAFLKIDGIPGESKDDQHKEWIEILSYHHNVNQPASKTASSAGGATAERVNFGDFSISKQVDMASPKILEASCNGRHIKEVIIEVCRAGGDKQKYLVIKMEQVLITNYIHDGGSDFPTEGVSFNPGKFTMEYIKQDRAGGTPNGSVMTGWNLMTNKATA